MLVPEARVTVIVTTADEETTYTLNRVQNFGVGSEYEYPDEDRWSKYVSYAPRYKSITFSMKPIPEGEDYQIARVVIRRLDMYEI